MARILCFDSDTHFSGHPGGQARFTEEFIEPLSDVHDVEVWTVMSETHRTRGAVTYRALLRTDQVTKSTQLSFARRQLDVVRREGEHFDLIVENFIPPIGPSGMPTHTTTPVIGLANFSFWDEMSAKYHVPFHLLTRHRLQKYDWIATTHESVSQRIRTLSPQTVTAAFGQVVEPGIAVWNDSPGERAVFLGRPDIHQKGLDLLVRSLHRLGSRAPDVALAGFDPSNKDWQKLVRRWPLSSSVEVLGYVRGTPKDDLLKSARALLLPSRYEGPSYVPLEGASRGVPTVAFDLPCFADRREFMYLARPFDISDFAAQIDRAFLDDRLYEEKRRASAETIQHSRQLHPQEEFRAFVTQVLSR